MASTKTRNWPWNAFQASAAKLPVLWLARELPPSGDKILPVTASKGPVPELVSDKASAWIGNAPTAAGSPPWRTISFLAIVVLPTSACLLYLVFLAAPQFVSETRFVVRGSLERLAIDSMGQAAALSALNNSQEAHVVADYIRSSQIVTDLAPDLDLRRLFVGSRFDLLWRLPDSASADKLIVYWRSMVSVNVDPTTGIVIVRVYAFRPEDALSLNRSLLSLSERLVAGFTERIRDDRLEKAEADLKLAQAELTALLSSLEMARRNQVTLDPLEKANALADLVGSLREERAMLAASRSAAVARLQEDALTVGLADDRIRSLDAQIELLLGSATGTGQEGSLLKAVSLFDYLQIRRELVSKRVSRAEHAVTKARLSAMRQQVYVDVFMSPTKGEIKVHPHPVFGTLAVFGALATCWAIGVLYFETVRERLW